MSDLTVLFEFLSSPNPAARQIALENLIGHTVKTDPARHVFIPSLSAPLFVEDEVEQEGQVKASASGSGLGAGAGKTAEEDRVKVRMLRDLSNLTRDQAVRLSLISLGLAGDDDWELRGRAVQSAMTRPRDIKQHAA